MCITSFANIYLYNTNSIFGFMPSVVLHMRGLGCLLGISIIDCFWHLLSFTLAFWDKNCAFLMAINLAQVFLSIDPFMMLGFVGQVRLSARYGPKHFAHYIG